MSCSQDNDVKITGMDLWLVGGAATRSTVTATEDGSRSAEPSEMEEGSADELPAPLAGAGGDGSEDRSSDCAAPMDTEGAESTSTTTAVTTGTTAVATTTATSSSSGSSSSNNSSTEAACAKYNACDDEGAPAAVLLDARQLRQRIHENTGGGMGLMIHSFRIRRRVVSEKKKRKLNQSGVYDEWCVECRTCETGKALTLTIKSSNHALCTFERDHLRSKGHLNKGSELLARVDLVGAATNRDNSAAGAAADTRLAIERQTFPTELNDTSLRRDALPISHLPAEPSAVEVLVRDNEALGWTGGASSLSSTTTTAIAGHVHCIFCNYTSHATAEDASLLSELAGHLASRAHEHVRSYRGGVHYMFSRERGQAPPPAPPPDLSRLCWGFSDKELKVNGEVLKTDALLNYDAGNLDWYPEPHTQESFTHPVTGEAITVNGTFRSREPKCARFCTLTTMARLSSLSCVHCASIKSRATFRNALARRYAESDRTKINFKVIAHQNVRN